MATQEEQILYLVTLVHQHQVEAELYSFTWDDGSLMLSAQPAAIKPSMLKMMVGITETTFDKTMKKNSADMELAKKRTEVSYGTFKGTELAYTITTKKAGVTTRQVIYMLTDGERIWNGQVSVESDKDLAIARTILEKAKPIDKNAKKKQPDFAKPKKP